MFLHLISTIGSVLTRAAHIYKGKLETGQVFCGKNLRDVPWNIQKSNSVESLKFYFLAPIECVAELIHLNAY